MAAGRGRVGRYIRGSLCFYVRVNVGVSRVGVLSYIVGRCLIFLVWS